MFPSSMEGQSYQRLGGASIAIKRRGGSRLAFKAFAWPDALEILRITVTSYFSPDY